MINKTKDINLNYAAKICRVDAVEPIVGADRIVNATLGNDKAIVSKDMKVGDIVVFFPCECSICHEYLSTNNLYSDPELNSNCEEYKAVEAAAEEGYEEVLKSMRGFFNRNGRVRMLKLRGEYSLGFVAPITTLEKTWPELKSVIWSHHLNEQFDLVNENRICWKYIPANLTRKKDNDSGYSMPWYKRSMRRLKKFDRLVPGQFAFHYDTGKLADNIHLLSPLDECDITVKVHGTSVIIANVLINRELSLWEKIKKFFGVNVPLQEYGNIYSSRRVIKNRYIDKKTHNQYYDTDVHGCVDRDFSQFLSPGMTVYGEIVGYCEGESKFIQKDHDYGCVPGEWKFMPYRITMTDKVGNIKEYEISEVIEWTNLIKEICEKNHPELVNKIMPMTLLYHGFLGDMYDNLYARTAEALTEEQYEQEIRDYVESNTYDGYLPKYLSTPEEWVMHKWRTAWLDTMKKDTKFLGLEKREPLCKNKVPREGIVIRKCHDTRAEAFKLKSAAHFHLEMMQHDAGEIDMEEES